METAYLVKCSDDGFGFLTTFLVIEHVSKAIANSIARHYNKVCPICQTYFVEKQ